MKSATKLVLAVLWRLPGGPRLIRLLVMTRMRKRTRKEIFTRHYLNNWWGDAETRSGVGATLRYTENIRHQLPRLLTDLGVTRVLDAPCGDFNWFRHITLPEHVQYIGADIVAPLIAKNRREYANGRVQFIELDIAADPLPHVDLWICRAALIHFSDEDLWATLDNFLRSNIRYLLTTTLPHSRGNRNIVTGDHRLLNLEAPPFSFGPTLRAIDDWIEGFEVNRLALWSRDELAHRLASNATLRHFRKRRAQRGRIP